MKLRHTWGWIAPLALALLAVASLALVPATQSAAAGASPITVPFDHLTTGFELDGVHRDLPCESCHLNAVFRGTPRNCGTCHIKGSLFNATPKTQTHVLTSNNCAACHNTISFRPQVHFDHAEAMGSCVSCHNGIIATGKGPTHPATSDNCAACHTVMSWNPPSAVDHTQIPLAVAGFCIICHNGSAATGKNKGHIATSLECGDCHLTTTWLGANFDHTGITSGCASCHNGTKAVGKQGNHMPTTNLCESCHTTGIGTKTPSWVPSKFDHTQMTTVNTCLPCHNGTVKITTGIVSGLPVSHVPLSSGTPDCILCHGNNPAAETWTVLAADIPTLHTKLNTGNCLLCHGGQTFAGVPAPFIPMSISGVSPYKKAPLAPPHIPVMAGTDCSACHGPAYRAGGFGPATAMSATTHQFVSTTCDTCHDTGKSFYVGSGTPLQLRPADHVNSNDPRMATSDCSVCHTTKDWISTAMPVGHMPNPSNLSCLTCHTKSPSDYTPATLAANSVLHTGITGNCGLCHGDNVSALTWANNYTPKDALLTPPHIPYLSGTDCSSCHTSGTYAVGTFGPMNMTPAKHAFVPTACNTCHEKGLSYFMGAANPALQGRPADHNTGQMVAPNDCSICHTTANWNSNALPVGHMPNPGNAACTVCHTDVTNYKALASIPVLHTGVTGGCGTCHGATTVLTWYNNYVPKDALLTPSHIPYLSGADCSSCHTPNYVAGGFGPTNMSATKHAFVPTTCDTCHEAGMTFYLGASTPALQGRPASHLTSTNPQEKTGDCSGCHNTMDWTTTAKPVNHMPTPGTQTCSVCHTAIGSTEASYAALASVPVLHTGITGNCGQCHGNYTAALTWYNAYTPKDAILTPLHIPYLVGTDCSSCHAPNYTTGGFGPTNMSAAKHAFVPTTCKTCHETGSNFYLGASTPALQTRPTSGPNDHIHNPSLTQMIAGDCSQCHNTTVWTTPKTLPGGHMPIPGTQVCTVCHTAAASGNYNAYASIPVLHTGITTGCAQCHGGATPTMFYNNHDNPTSAPSNHIPSFNNNDCSACHTANYTVGGFGPMIMTQATHTNVSTTACKTCHEAGLSFFMGKATPGLQGRPADHTTAAMAAPNDCAGCHTTANWNSNTMPAGHMPNPANTACNVCHITAPASYKTLAINSILHTGISGNCGLCHGGTAGALTWYNAFTPKAAVLAPAHIPYLAGTDCSGCHSSSSYAAGTFGPMNMTQAKHSFVPTSCNTCHEKGLSFYMGAANPGLQGRPADHTSAAMSAPNDCGGCHTTANWNSNTLPAGHMPNPANDACTVCHINTANYKILAANSVLHTGISSNCGQCHGGTTPLTWYNAFTPKAAVLSPAHIPYLAGADCSSCHSSSTYAAGTFGPSNMTQARHAFVTTNCVTCHEKGVSFYMGAANPALQGRPADHTSGAMLTGNCGSCHTTANWNSTSGALPAGHMPNPGNQGCSVCHIAAPANYKTLAANAVLHTGIGSGCITCHAAPNAAPLVFYLNFTPKAAAGLAPPHIPTSSTPCESCHTISFTSFSGTTMSAAKHTTMLSVTGGTCDQCHGPNTLTFYGVNNLTTRPGANHGGGKDCNGCHSPNSWNGGKAKKTVAAAKTPTRSTIGTVVAAPAAPSTQAGAAPTATPQTRAAQTATPQVSVSRAGAIQSGRSIGAGTGTVSHAGVTSNCASCHNGVLAAGKGPTHIASNNTCQNCHTTIAWLPARFDHQGVTARCASCHNGVVALGKPRLHVQTNQDCGACHGTITWTAVRFSHVGISAMCQSCHNGITATGKQVQHVRTTLDCGSCHNTLNWTIVNVPARPRPLIPSPRGAPSGPTK